MNIFFVCAGNVALNHQQSINKAMIHGLLQWNMKDVHGI